MRLSSVLQRAVPAAVFALAIVAAPVVAFQPTVPITDGDPGHALTVTDLSGRGGDLVASIADVGSVDARTVLMHSTDGGVVWVGSALSGADRGSQATVCAGDGVMVYETFLGGTSWGIDTLTVPLNLDPPAQLSWTTSGIARKPDIACTANEEMAMAWFEKQGSRYHVRLRTAQPLGADQTSQSFDLGLGTVGRGLSIAASSSRVYVTWFDGSTLKLRRYRIGSSSGHHLTSLGTATIATLKSGAYPQVGSDGHRVLLAYMDRASLKVRRSTDSGSSFGSPKTLRFEGFPGEIGAFPLTVAVHGSTVAIGAVESAELGGKGLGYLSTNGGSSYAKVSQHPSGRVMAGLVKIGGSYRYSEAWDQSITQPDPQSIQFRRQ